MFVQLALPDFPFVRPWPDASPGRSQARVQLFAQRTTALDEERLVDGLVGHLHLRVIGYSEPTTPRSAGATTWPRACARRPLGVAGTRRALPALVAAPVARCSVGDQGPVLVRPPLTLTSGTPSTVTGRGLGDGADRISRRQAPEISSRLQGSRSSERCRSAGRFPPASAMNLRNDKFRLPRCLAMRLTGTPASRMSQIVCRSSR